MPLKSPPEVIVIGAGLGGLSAAYELSKAGARVLVLERHNLPGGLATSFVRGRFEFEPSLHELGNNEFPGAAGFLRDPALDIELLKVPDAYRLLLTGENIDFRAPFGLDDFIDAVSGAVPGSRESVENYMTRCRIVSEAFRYLSDASPPSPRVLFRNYRDFLRTGAATVDEVADAAGLPREARNLIYPYWCYLGVSTDRLSHSIWASMLISYIENGAVIPRGRSHAITAALESGIRANGGEIRFNSEVTGIETEGKRIVGVTLASGGRISCDRVISNVLPHRLFGSFLPHGKVPRRALRLANARRIGPSFLVVYLGLDADRETLGLTDYSYFIAPDMDTVSLAGKMVDRNAADPMQASVCLNAADEQASPPGTTILSITIGTLGSAWQDVSPWNYHSAKYRFAELAIDQFTRATGVKIRGHIEEMEVAAPPTFSRYTRAWNGAVYIYETEPWDSIVPRALNEEKERFLEGLRFAGGHAFRAYGYSSSLMSGRISALKTLGDMNR